MSQHREPLRRIGTERITIMGVPRKWFLIYFGVAVIVFQFYNNKLVGFLAALGFFFLAHIPASILAERDPYFFHLLWRSLAERKIYEA
ncbi:VirB3 family type IV secretion system protein [Elstera sp.]|jgi:type IV secretory pathway TrbD component|uniref:VirB3 family type IV secretion system protein n=1 Tax=Elstera sp. TaxID=1916664 RepID=UPI0037C0E092